MGFQDDDGRNERFEIRSKNLMKVSKAAPLEKRTSDMKEYGINLFDPVIYTHPCQGHSRGVVLDEGPSSDTVMVKFRVIGTKAVRLAQLNKVALNDEILQELKEVSSKAERRRMKRLAAASWAGVQLSKEEEERVLSAEGLPPRLKVRDLVKAKLDPWKELDVGMVVGAGEKPGTVRVRFNVQHETWTLKCKDVKEVDYPGLCKFTMGPKREFPEFD